MATAPTFISTRRWRSAAVVRAVLLLFIALIRVTQAPLAALGAPAPGHPPVESPLSAEEQLATFTLPPGFNIELVAAEPDGGKFVAITFDHAGRLWTMTALEYPLDANESPAEAQALFARGGRDRVLVFDTPTRPGRQRPRVFAEGLVIPLGLLPYRDGAFVQYGGEIRFYRDTDGDGRADTFAPVLAGFGIEDSHLFPHQFIRAPGGWILLAQGAFNYSKVKAGDGSVTDYNKTKLARFTPDGNRFEIIGWGPCNIWGLVIDRLGEVFIQEANDQGWPMMPFLEGASYPLCGDDVPRPYAPPFPKTGEIEMGGTGLSGLAFSEGADSFPAPWRDVFFIANPITGKIQAIRCHRSSQPDVSSSNAGGTAGSTPHLDPLPLKRVEEKRVARKVHSRNAPPKVATLSLPAEGRGRGDGWPAKGMVSYGNGWRLEHLPDFIQCADPWFRPVAMDFGPDGRLYIVDWYNKIISHNEVPRNHPERDKIRGRIWRVRHQSQSHRGTVPNLDRVSEKQLLAHLRAANTWEVNAAWEEVVDRQAVSLVPALARLVTDEAQPDDLRLRALWCLEGLGKVQPAHLKKLAGARHRALRMQALRVARDTVGQASRLPIPLRIGLAERGLADPDRLVRQEALRLLGALLEESRGTTTRARRLVGLLFEAASQPPESGGPKFQPYFAAFETYLVRRALERSPDAVATWLDARPAAPVELQALGCVTLGGSSGAKRLAALLPELARRLSAEELFLLASDPNEPAAKAALEAALADPGALRLFYDNRARLTDHASLGPLLADAVRALVKNDPTGDNQDLLVKLASAFKLESLENDLVGIVQRAAGILPADPPARPIAGPASPARSLAAVRALRELQSTRVDLFKALARSNRPDLQREGVLALAVARSDAAVPALLEVWPSLTTTLRKTAVDRLASSATNARALVSAISRDAISRDELDGYTLDKLATVLPDDADVQRLVSELGPTLQPVLRLNGGTDDRVDTNLTLDGPFTVECWVKLDPGIGNEDSILAGVGALDANFHESRFRVFVANGPGDIVIARRPMAPDSWTHVAFTRDAEGRFRVYINGELDNTGERTDRRQFERLQIGLSLAAGGTAGELAEFRVWSECRSSDEIRSAANLALAVNGPRASSPAAARPVREGMDPLAQHIAPQPGRRPATLLYLGTGESWGRLLGNARIERTAELPPLQTEADAAALAAKFDTFRKLANSDGDAARGREIFGTVCGVCHSVGGQGGRIGPVLDGAAANGVEALLRNVLTPNAAMEAGYRRFRVETGDGELQEGLLVLQDDAAIVLRQINGEDLGIPRARVKRAAYTKLSMMPEGLIEPLPPSQVSDLFAYLKTLK